MTGPVRHERSGRITGVVARPDGGEERRDRGPRGGGSGRGLSRLSVAMGLRKRDDRPLGVAVRTYYKSPRHDDDYLESGLDLWDGYCLLPGYGWIFGMVTGRPTSASGC